MIGIDIIKRIMHKDREKNYSEEDLIKQAQRGDDLAFERLMDLYESYLYKMAFLYVKNEQDAMDIYQETTLKAYMNISKLKNLSSFKTWITRILINNVYNRNNQYKKMKEEKIEDYIGECSYSTIESNIDLYDALDLLKENYRTPIILQYFYGLTIQQISQITNTNENTVKTNIRRAKKKMYDALKEDVND